MTQRSDSWGHVYGGSASKVPFPRFKRIRLDRKCDSQVRLTSAVRSVHAKDQRSKTDVYTSLVYKECLELLLLSLVRTEKWHSFLYPTWSSTPRARHMPSTLFTMNFLVNFHTFSIQFSHTLVHF